MYDATMQTIRSGTTWSRKPASTNAERVFRPACLSGATASFLARLPIGCILAAAALGLCATVPSHAADRELGEYLSSQCIACHQKSGKAKGIPSIVGWDRESFIAIMDAYKRKERENKVMQTIAGSLSDEDVAALAAYFGSLTPTE
jgi:cytochrome c553